MADPGQSDPPPQGILGSMTRAAAALGAFIAVGQSAVQGIKSWSDYEIAKVKAKHELEIQDVKDRTSLANDYLDRLMKSDVSNPDKLMLLGALSTIERHPLRAWAALRKEQLEKDYRRQLEERTNRIEKLISTAGTSSEETLLQAKIDEAYQRLKSSQDDPKAAEAVEIEIRGYIQEFATAKGRAGLQITVARSAVAVDRTADLSKIKETVQTASKLTVDLIMQAVPEAPPDNVKRFAPFLISAIREYEIVDEKLIAYIIATVREETGTFEPRTEPGTDPYRGRGFLIIAGRTNYSLMSERLGLGDLLVRFPDLANDPGLASRILCSYISAKSEKIRSALDANNLTQARGAVTGGWPVRIDRFSEVYRRVIEKF